MEAKGYLCRCENKLDARSVCYDLTAEGREVLLQDPLRDLTQAIAALPESLRCALGTALPLLVADLARRREAPSFGTCHDCRHFEGGDQGAFCACMAKGLAAGDVNLLCVNFNCDANTLPPRLKG